MAIGEDIRTLLAQFQGTVITPMDPRGNMEVIELDVTRRRSHEDDGSYATFPVEHDRQGYATDNYHREPTQFSCEGLLTDTPLRFGAGFAAGPGRSVEMYDKLREWQRRAEPLLVVTRIRAHDDMGLASITVEEDPESGNAIAVSLRFEHVRILRSATLDSRFDVYARQAGAGGTTDMGRQSLKSPFTGRV